MPDTTTLANSKTRGWTPVHEMHPHHARNMLAKILRDPDYAARHFQTPIGISDRNLNLHWRAGGTRYLVKVRVPVPVPGPNGVAMMDAAPQRCSRRVEARAYHRWAKSIGYDSAIYKITAEGLLEKVR